MDGGGGVFRYREDGYFPEAFINLLALPGWNPGTEQEFQPEGVGSGIQPGTGGQIRVAV